MMPPQHVNAFLALRAYRQSISRRDFKARGVSVLRCERCQLSSRVCLCDYRLNLDIQSEFILLMHHDEIFKPTNTGRLIADIFPNQTHAFAWNRTQPDNSLLCLLKDPSRRCYILYPENTDNNQTTPMHHATHCTNKRPLFDDVIEDGKRSTFVLLDGTWKQSARMLRLSRWLDNLPSLILPKKLTQHINGQYLVRKAHIENQLATAQAAQLCLMMAGESQAADILGHYFAVFNEHYIATRMNTKVETGDSHRLLIDYKNSLS